MKLDLKVVQGYIRSHLYYTYREVAGSLKLPDLPIYIYKIQEINITIRLLSLWVSVD